MTLFLVRHGRSAPRSGVPAHEWELDPAGYDDIWALRESGRLPDRAAWFTSPEPKAIGTASLLTDGEVGVMLDLREHVRDSTDLIEDFPAVVERAFAEPERSAYVGWEPLASCRERVSRAVEGILAAHAEEDVVLVGHGTAWTALVAALTGEPADLARWRTLAMPDLIVVTLDPDGRPGTAAG
ncbi:histidine phosphatase family protein [Nocardioides panaciterrulae]|uniref:Broad specificity phosphatase PhoE n=1 Tax=Nocardioides panaciterrulae TaxID=661492 RepID=A0A7Y9E766_9ACTN|nr:histidine phosphatase family protein [Nocardioides panaciterrulae]NYD42405.1 broad specificity phosphatase PhoE [Nocardioides panaciterrulae]